MNCPHCGAPQEGNLHFCTHCGQTLMQNGVPMQPAHTMPVPPVYPALQVPEDHKPISPWGYLGYTLLYCIPVLGWIFLLIFSFGGSKNINVRNYARSYGILYLISIILAVVILVLMLALFGSLLASFEGMPA